MRIGRTYLSRYLALMNPTRSYGTSEAAMTQLDLKSGKIDTKIHPDGPGGHSPRNTFQGTLDNFQPYGIKISVLCLHRAGRATPYEDTVAKIDKIHKDSHL